MSSKVSFNELTKNAKINFKKILERSWLLWQKFSKEYGKDDVRCDFFIVFSELNLSLLLQLDHMLELLKQTNIEIDQYMKLTPNDRVQFLLQFDTLNRANYLTHGMFEVENFLKSLKDGLGIQSTEGYYKFTEKLLAHLSITDTKKHKILNLPAQVRNSLHNNGYSTRDFEIELRRNTYKIEQGKQINFSGWDHMYIFFDELLDVLVEIIDNPIMKNISKIPHNSMYEQHM